MQTKGIFMHLRLTLRLFFRNIFYFFLPINQYSGKSSPEQQTTQVLFIHIWLASPDRPHSATLLATDTDSCWIWPKTMIMSIRKCRTTCRSSRNVIYGPDEVLSLQSIWKFSTATVVTKCCDFCWGLNPSYISISAELKKRRFSQRKQ